jgi:hypothetical protein
VDDAWEAAYIEALEATGRQDEAQRWRWAAFEERLSADRQRAYGNTGAKRPPFAETPA